MTKETFFERVASYQKLAKKEVGQNFLIDPAAAERIVSLGELTAEDSVLEIGCGAGSLTYFLSLTPSKIEGIDIDGALLMKINQDFAGCENMSLHQGNAMDFDYSPYSVIIGNLPYYITSGIIEKVLLGATSARKAIFMVQKEAADRILAKPGTKEYSPLTVLLYAVGTPKKEFNVNRNSFAPAPHVDSSVISITFKNGLNFNEIAAMHRLCSRLFLQRRKTILNNLKAVIGEKKAKEALEKAGIPPLTRPEQIKVEQYLMLSKLISE